MPISTILCAIIIVTLNVGGALLCIYKIQSSSKKSKESKGVK